ncbi:MAG: rRNA maturation RNase YbeY [Polyangiaceae bacterium]
MTTRGGPHRGADPRTIERRALKMLRELALEGVELSVALVDDACIQELNRDFRGKDRPTDVLAFAMREGEAMPESEELELLGDVVISVETARRQAERRGRRLLDELTMLLGHGLLHLLGYDHATKAEEKVMVEKTRQLEAVAARRG